jgi:hypothetical protein
MTSVRWVEYTTVLTVKRVQHVRLGVFRESGAGFLVARVSEIALLPIVVRHTLSGKHCHALLSGHASEKEQGVAKPLTSTGMPGTSDPS